MTNREIMQSLLAGKQPEITPQWIMAVAGIELVDRIIPKELQYEGYSMVLTGAKQHPWKAMGENLLRSQQAFNKHLDNVGFPVGWGANAAFGHCGPGEFAAKILEDDGNRIIMEYETGAKKEVRRRPHNLHIFDLPIHEPSDLDKLKLPDPNDPKRYAGLKEDIAWAKANGEWTISYVNGFFSAGHYFLCEFEDWFVNLAAEPEFAMAMVNRLGEWTLAAAKHLCELGVDCIGFCDDLGSQQAMLISPDMYKKYFWSWHKKLCDLVHSYGAVVHMHSHGAILPVLPLLAEAGVDILNPLDPDDDMPMAAARAAVGKKMVLCGGMDKHFWDWTPEKQAEHLQFVVAEGRRLGPHILMDSAGVAGNVTKENFDSFLAMSREIRGAGRRCCCC